MQVELAGFGFPAPDSGAKHRSHALVLVGGESEFDFGAADEFLVCHIAAVLAEVAVDADAADVDVLLAAPALGAADVEMRVPERFSQLLHLFDGLGLAVDARVGLVLPVALALNAVSGGLQRFERGLQSFRRFATEEADRIPGDTRNGGDVLDTCQFGHAEHPFMVSIADEMTVVESMVRSDGKCHKNIYILPQKH